MKTMLAITSLALVGLLGLASPARAQQTTDIVDTAVAAGSFTTMAKALTAADLVASNGVIHVVDAFLLPSGE